MDTKTYKKTIKVLVATGLYPPEGGGPATYAKSLHDLLPEKGVEAVILPFREVRGLLPGIRHIVYFFKCLKRGYSADIILALDPVSVGLPARCASFFLRKKFVVKVVGDYAWEQGKQRFGITELLDDFLKRESYPFFVQILIWVERFVASGADAVIVPSEYLKKVVCIWGIKKENIHVVYNAAPELERVGHKKVLRGLLKYHDKYIVTIARLVPWKGITEVVDAVAEMKKHGIDVKFLVIGSGPSQEAFEAYAEEKAPGMVSFTGDLDNEVALAYVKAADVFVLHTGYEGFSHVLLEASALGSVIVSTDVGGNKEIVQHNRSGLLVPYKDTAALTKALTRSLTDEKFRRSVSEAAKRRVKKFTKDAMIRDTITVFEKIL